MGRAISCTLAAAVFFSWHLPTASGATVFTGDISGGNCSAEGDVIISGNSRIVKNSNNNCVAAKGDLIIRELSVEKGATARFGTDDLAGWHADVTCKQGDLDCNVCAKDVIHQFNALFDKADPPAGTLLDDDVRQQWTFTPKARVRPSNLRITDFFGVTTLSHHIQGFVRTNHPLIQYAGTYSQALKSDDGSIFFVTREPLGEKLSLFALHSAFDKHPSGISVIGNYVLFGDHTNGRVLRIINVSRSLEKQNAVVPLNKDLQNKSIGGMGGGVGMVKMDDSSYLLVLTQPGGAKDKINPHTYFYKVTLGQNSLRNKHRDPLGTLSPTNSDQLDIELTFIGKWKLQHQNFAPFGEDFQYAENLSVISECGTGDIYVAHTSGLGRLGIEKQGYWRVSKIKFGLGSPELIPMAVYTTNQNEENCYLKAAATAWVNSQNRIELYCHEFRWSSREKTAGKNRLRFRKRILKPL